MSTFFHTAMPPPLPLPIAMSSSAWSQMKKGLFLPTLSSLAGRSKPKDSGPSEMSSLSKSKYSMADLSTCVVERTRRRQRSVPLQRPRPKDKLTSSKSPEKMSEKTPRMKIPFWILFVSSFQFCTAVTGKKLPPLPPTLPVPLEVASFRFFLPTVYTSFQYEPPSPASFPART